MNEELQKYIDECIRENGGEIPTMEKLNVYLGEFMQKQNSRPIPAFEGYSSKEMYIILHGTFTERSPIQLQPLPDTEYEAIPIYRQIKYMIKILRDEGQIKLTANGNLPIRIVREVYPLGVKDDYIENGLIKLTREINSESVQLSKILLKIMKVVKERKNIMTLTKEGEKIVRDNHRLFKVLMESFCCQFNMSYFDGYVSEEIGQLGAGFSLILVSKYGSEKHSHKFYADKYFAAFPMLLNFEPHSGTVEEEGLKCYSIRTFDRLLLHLGLIEIDEEQKYGKEHKKDIIKTMLFDKLIKCLPPQGGKGSGYQKD